MRSREVREGGEREVEALTWVLGMMREWEWCSSKRGALEDAAEC